MMLLRSMLSVLILAAAALRASPPVVLPPVAYADTETTTNVVLAAWDVALMSVSGCERDSRCDRDLSKNAGSLTSESSRIKTVITSLDGIMTSSGNRVFRTGERIVAGIGALPDSERKVLSVYYVNKLNDLCDDDVDFFQQPVRLYNFQGLLKSLDSCMDYLEDPEKVFRLYEHCTDCYRQALTSCREKRRAETDPLLKSKIHGIQCSLETDFKMLTAYIQKVYLPHVASRKLPKDRYDYWRRVLERKSFRDSGS